ncbi:MAG: hypothetical protein Q9168_003286 [Polycauliona sp. 1 TL-2023]
MLSTTPTTLTLYLLTHLTTHLTFSQSVGDRINQFSPQWHCNVDSWEDTSNDCNKAIDSNDNTFWHTQYNPTDDPLPHRIIIDMGELHAVRSLTYLPRQDGNSNGNIGDYRISLSADQETTARTINGTWADNAERKIVDLGNATMARYVRLDAFTEAGNRGPWTSVCQIDIYEDNGSSTPNEPSHSNASPVANSKSSKSSKSSSNSNSNSSSSSSNPYARPNLAVIDGQTVTLGGTMTLGPRPTGGAMGGSGNSSTSEGNMTATATASSSTGAETATSTPTGEGVSGGAPAGSSGAMSGKVSGLGVMMVGMTAAMVVVGSMFFQL